MVKEGDSVLGNTMCTDEAAAELDAKIAAGPQTGWISRFTKPIKDFASKCHLSGNSAPKEECQFSEK